VAAPYAPFVRFTDWLAWHKIYDDPASEPSRRLRLLHAHLRDVLDDQPPGPIRVVIPCAGQGRDLLGVLVDHPRRGDVVATLIDLDPGNLALARSTAKALRLPGITVVAADAGRTEAYARAVPASIIMLAGFIGYLSDRDVSRLITMLPQLCDSDAVVIWARRIDAQRRTVTTTRALFEVAGFREVPTDIPDEPDVHVGVERFTGTPVPLHPHARLFHFRDPLNRKNVEIERIHARIASHARRLMHALLASRS
jgi:hypothetical protein